MKNSPPFPQSPTRYVIVRCGVYDNATVYASNRLNECIEIAKWFKSQEQDNYHEFVVRDLWEIKGECEVPDIFAT